MAPKIPRIFVELRPRWPQNEFAWWFSDEHIDKMEKLVDTEGVPLFHSLIPNHVFRIHWRWYGIVSLFFRLPFFHGYVRCR